MAAQPSVVLVAGGGQPQPSGSLGQRAVDGTALDVCDDPRGIRDTCWQCRLQLYMMAACVHRVKDGRN